MRGVYPFLTTFIHSFRRQKLYEKNLLTSKQKLVFCFGFVFRLSVFCFHELHKGSKYRGKRKKRQWRHLGFLKISYIFLSFAFFYVHLYVCCFNVWLFLLQESAMSHEIPTIGIVIQAVQRKLLSCISENSTCLAWITSTSRVFRTQLFPRSFFFFSLFPKISMVEKFSYAHPSVFWSERWLVAGIVSSSIHSGFFVLILFTFVSFVCKYSWKVTSLRSYNFFSA